MRQSLLPTRAVQKDLRERKRIIVECTGEKHVREVGEVSEGPRGT